MQEAKLLQSYLNDFECGNSLLNDADDTFYSGLVPWLSQQGVDFQIEDDQQPEPLAVKDIVVDPTILKNRTLRDYQIAATRKAMHYGRGIVQSPTGSGKSEMAAAAYAHFNLYGLVDTMVYLTPTIFLMEQTASKLEYFGLGPVGRVGGGYKFKPGYQIYVFVVSSAYRGLQKRTIANFIARADLLVLDEAHHAAAKSWTQVAEWCRSPYRLAYTATVHDDPECYSYIDMVLIGLMGPIFFEVRSKELRERGYLADPLVTVLRTRSQRITLWDWDGVYVAGIVHNRIRNSMIVSLAAGCFKGGNKVMIFISRRKHGHRLAKALVPITGKEVCFVHGDNTAHIYRPSGIVKRHRWSVKDIADYINERDQAILITTTVLDEGLDIPVINVLIMGTAMKKYRRTVQRCGRGMRPKEGQNKVFIFDFYDDNHPYLEKHSKYRLWTYEEEIFHMSPSLDHTAVVMGAQLEANRQLLAASRPE